MMSGGIGGNLLGLGMNIGPPTSMRTMEDTAAKGRPGLMSFGHWLACNRRGSVHVTAMRAAASRYQIGMQQSHKINSTLIDELCAFIKLAA